MMGSGGGPYYYSGYDDLATRYRANQLLAAIAAAQNSRVGGGSSILRDALASDITVFNAASSLPPLQTAAYYPSHHLLHQGLFFPHSNQHVARGNADLSPRAAAALYALQQQQQQQQDILLAGGGGSLVGSIYGGQHPQTMPSLSASGTD
jgi:hypothetical protein